MQQLLFSFEFIQQQINQYKRGSYVVVLGKSASAHITKYSPKVGRFLHENTLDSEENLQKWLIATFQ